MTFLILYYFIIKLHLISRISAARPKIATYQNINNTFNKDSVNSSLNEYSINNELNNENYYYMDIDVVENNTIKIKNKFLQWDNNSCLFDSFLFLFVYGGKP